MRLDAWRIVQKHGTARAHIFRPLPSAVLVLRALACMDGGDHLSDNDVVSVEVADGARVGDGEAVAGSLGSRLRGGVCILWLQGQEEVVVWELRSLEASSQSASRVSSAA